MVSGTITNGYTVWVNGVQATNNGNGTWTANILPICVGGGLVQVTGVPDGSGQNLNSQFAVPSPQGVFISAYHDHNKRDYNVQDGNGGWHVNTLLDNMDWQDGQGGTGSRDHLIDGDGNNYWDWNYAWDWWDWWWGWDWAYPYYDDEVNWPLNNWPQALPNGKGTAFVGVIYQDGQPQMDTIGLELGQPDLVQEHCDTIQALNGNVSKDRRTADTEVKLATGGPLGSTQQNLWIISATATDVTTGRAILPNRISIGCFGNLDTNGELYVILPDNDPDTITPNVGGNNNYRFTVTATKLSSKVVYYSIAPDSVPQSFNASNVQTTLQSQLSAKVFDNLSNGQNVQIKVHVDKTYPGRLGWNGNPKHIYVNRVDWTTLNVGFASSSGGETSINPMAVNNWIIGLGGNNPTTQTWVNILAHEGIWLNAGGNFDNNGNPDGEISSGTAYGFSEFTVLPSSRSTLRSKFGF